MAKPQLPLVCIPFVDICMVEKKKIYWIKYYGDQHYDSQGQQQIK